MTDLSKTDTGVSSAAPATAIARALVTLDTPIARGDTTIDRVAVRKPGAGEFRGLTMLALSQLDYAALETLLPRITKPALTKAEIATLDPADLMQLGGEVMDFLLPKAAKADSPTA